MATRGKKRSGSATPPEQPGVSETKRRGRSAPSTKTTAAPRASASSRARKVEEEAQNVGADIVPVGPIEVDAPAAPSARAAKDESPSRPDTAAGARPVEKGDRRSATKPGGPKRTGRTDSVLKRTFASGEAAEKAHAPAPPQPAAAKPASPPASQQPLRTQDSGVRTQPQLATQPAQTGKPESLAARDTGRGPTVEPGAIREHRVDQIEPVVDRGAPQSLLSDWDLHLFNEGTHNRLWEKLGSHIVAGGAIFSVWAPNAERVSVVGDFNGWNPEKNALQSRGASGIWETFVPGIGKGSIYKYHIVSRHNGYTVNKADPLAVHNETPPRTASIVWDLDYEWHDPDWMKNRRARNSFTAPIAIYELHLGSWRRTLDNGGFRPMSYGEIAAPLAEYVKKMNFTHIELLPVMEHPFYGSWGYQCTGFFAPTSRYGTPQELKYLIDVLHQNGIGVILDWVPSHFPADEHGLSYFDGTHLYEHADPRKGFHPDWGSLIFNYGRNEVRSFLLSSAMYWLSEFHADGLRVDAVASMLYLDYSRNAGEWIPNEFGGRENVEAISFLRRLNEDVYKAHPDVQVIAEESTAWPMVSRPTYIGGLGFGMKWDMGWMHDTLRYFSKEPVYRKFHHNDLTFRMMYAFTENFVLPLSHDEVVHGKGSLIGKMPGDEWQRFANLRLLFAHMYSQPAKKMIFMGGEIGQGREWNHDESIEWDLLKFPMHAALARWVEDLNRTYREIPALHELDMDPAGFEWIDCCDTENSIVSLLRKSRSKPDEMVVVVLNFTPVPRHNYQVGLPQGGSWREILNSDAPLYGGSGQGNMGGVEAVPIRLHGRRWSAALTLPPLGAVFLLSEGSGKPSAKDGTQGLHPDESAEP